MLVSLNNRFVVEQYKKQELKAEVSGGFAKMSHKQSLFPLKVLVATTLSDGTDVEVGSTVYVKEEMLFSKVSAGQNGSPAIPTYVNKDIAEEPFHIIEANQIEMINLVRE